jgi:hypothetical protein
MGVICNERKKTRQEKVSRARRAKKWIKVRKGPPKGSPWQVPMEDLITNRLPWKEWWLKKWRNCGA